MNVLQTKTLGENNQLDGKMKVKYDSRVTRTSGWKTQPIYDEELSTMDISSLRFLNYKYKIDIRDFSKDYSLDLK